MEFVDLNGIVVCLCWFLVVSSASVFRSLYVLLRWPQLSVRCSFQSCCLCSCIILSMLLFSVASCGSVGISLRILFLSLMAVLIYSGRCLCMFCILPCYMFCCLLYV